MAIHRTVWSPDTCACRIELVWDDTEVNRTHEIQPISFCSVHAALPALPLGATLESVTFAPHEQNTRKNKFLGAALEALTDLRDGVTGNYTLKNGVEMNYSWSGLGDSRVLLIIFVGVVLTAQKKTTLQTRADQLFGAGKVVVT